MKSLFEKLKSETSKLKQDADKLSPSLQWLGELTNLDDLAALEKSTHFLSSFSTSAIPEEQRLESLLIIDQANHQRAQNVFQQYVKFNHLRPELDGRLAEIAYYFHRQLSLNYQLEIAKLSRLVDMLKLHAQTYPLALLRGMQAICTMIKIRRLRQQPCPNAAWLELFELYRLAERDGLLAMQIRPYEEATITSIDAYFVHECMLDTLQRCNMSRQQFELAGELIRRLAPKEISTAHYQQKKHLYFVDVGQDVAPRRIEQLPLNTSCRFWELDEVLIQIDLITHVIKQKKSLESFGLGSMASHPNLQEVISIIKQEWLHYKAQRRKETRRVTNKLASVSWGIEAVIKQMVNIFKKPPSTSKSFEERLASHSVSKHVATSLTLSAIGERWTISDESNNGYGAKVDHEHAISIKPGKLSCLHFPEDDNSNVLGIVRDAVELPQQKHHIGIEVIARHASIVRLLKSSSVDAVKQDEELVLNARLSDFACIYLPVESGLSEQATIILPRLDFIENTLYQINTKDEKILVKLGMATDMKDDWARVIITRVSS